MFSNTKVIDFDQNDLSRLKIRTYFMENKCCVFLNDASCCLIDNRDERSRLLFDLRRARLPLLHVTSNIQGSRGSA